MQEITGNPGISSEHFFYTLTAPTGIGKTFGCLAFANKLIEQLPGAGARIIYCLPYTSIIDQNFTEFEKIIRFNKGMEYEKRPNRYLLKHHHLNPHTVKNRLSKEEYSYKDYLDDKLLVESWESAMIVTTFVQFFHSIIGNKNRLLKKFHHIVNSVVILDEVQNINPDYYQLLKDIFHILGTRFHTYFLLTTATQPEIFDIKKSNPISLVNSAFYTNHHLFNRVRLRVEKQPRTLTEFKQRFCQEFNGENCLIVLNTKGAAEEMYRYTRENKARYRVMCLTNNLVPVDRRHKLDIIKKSLEQEQKIILISTQLIEAGVDISFKYVYRDFGPLDSIIQVAGRCNRGGEYGERAGIMTLVRLIDGNHHDREFHTYIYKPIIAQLVEQTMHETSYESKDFLTLTRDYFNRFDFIRESRQLLNAIYELNYDRAIQDQTPIKDFRLIKEYDTESLYILTTAVLHLAAENNIDLIILDRNGEPVGRFWHSRFGSITTIRRRQLEFTTNDTGFDYARQWVINKLKNQEEFVKELAKNRPNLHEQVFEKCRTIENNIEKLENLQGSVDEKRNSIIGLEGSASRVYFEILSLCMPEKYRFKGRSRQPALDPP